MSDTQDQTPNSDIQSLPGAGRDVQAGVDPLTPEEQLQQLNNFFEDNYPEIFASLTTDEGAEFTAAGRQVPAELRATTERMWSRVPDLLTHSSQLVLGAGLDHAMPHVAFTKQGIIAQSWAQYVGDLNSRAGDFPQGVNATVLKPTGESRSVAIALHGGPGWFGDGQAHDQLWQPLFAGLAQQSGITIIDLTYPLPADVGITESQEAISQAVDVIEKALKPDGGIGAIVFGSGFDVAQQVWSKLQWLVALSPRIPAEQRGGLEGVDVLVSLASQDSRVTPESEVREFFATSGARVDYQQFLAEHIIATPQVWRERVEATANWMAER